jgi:hypothetical protein
MHEMRYIIIAMVLFLLGAGTVGLYSATREHPVPPITGDFAAAARLANKSGAPLLLVVDQAPAFL